MILKDSETAVPSVSVVSAATSRQQLLARYQRTPTEVLAAIANSDADQLLLIDFDETLWLRNSTEMFLASIRPALLLAIIVQLLSLLKPWRWWHRGDSEIYREYFRLKVILTLMPWAKKQWLAVAAELGPKYLNEPLYQALLPHYQRVHVVSFGFDFVVEPLLRAIDPKLTLTMVSTMPTAVQLRQQGKGATVINALGQEAVAGALCVTDALLDRDLLAQTKLGLLCKWPLAQGLRAGLTPMLPLVFTKKVNRPQEQYFTRVILAHDYIGLLLTFAVVSSQPVWCAMSLLLFVLAYFSIYETGYFENDRLGLLLESAPRVAPEFEQMGHHFKPWFAWLCGGLLALPAAFLAAQGSSWLPSYLGLSGITAAGLIWVVFMQFMVMVRAIFYWFNRISVQGRIVPMLLLQLARNFGYVLLFPTFIVGALFALTWTLAKWVPYVLYRYGGNVRGFPNHLVMGLMFAVMLLGVGASHPQGSTLFLNWPSGLVIGYVAIRAGKDLWGFRPALKMKKMLLGSPAND